MISHDKQDHFIYNLAAVSMLWPVSPPLALAVGSALPVVKDFWWDRKFGGNVQNTDVLWSWLGMVVAAGWSYFWG